MQIELLALSGANPKLTTMFDGAARAVGAHGRYHDAVARGNVYTVGDTAAFLTPAGLSTAPKCVTLYNPLGSGVFLSLLYASVTIQVVQVAAAACWVGVNPTGSVATTGTALAPQNMNGSGKVGAVKPLNTATLPALPTIFGDLGAALTGVITSVTGLTGLSRWFDGILGVGPGGALSLQMSTASAATSSLANWIWEEIPQSGTGAVLAA